MRRTLVTDRFQRTTTKMLFDRALRFDSRPAVVAPEGTVSYRQLLDASAAVAARLLEGRTDLQEARIAFLVPGGADHVAVQWGIWRAGGVAVPLAVMHPPAELEYVIQDAGAETVVVAPEFRGKVLAGGRGAPGEPKVLELPEPGEGFGAWRSEREPVPLPTLDPSRRMMIVYTSGTTGKPKGVVTTHANTRAQVESLIGAWGWSRDDRILNVLPLHHVHGIINILTCALWSGASCEFLPRFDAGDVLRRFARGDLTLFMAVPTVYSRLIAAWKELDADEQAAAREGCRKMRLMVCGSAALPVSVLETWKELTGHFLLERYGMTEIGMALSNPLHGERAPGHVGFPLPGVDVRLVDDEGNDVPEGASGEIVVRGAGVFLEYWNRPGATEEAFRDGWFRTGDVAVLEPAGYRILGRSSVDIIKTGGYKISALEIEETLRTHPRVAECAVVGLPDDEWGERVAACLVCSGLPVELDELRDWAKPLLAPYKIPTRLRIEQELPRNAMGKVNKPAVSSLFAGPGE